MIHRIVKMSFHAAEVDTFLTIFEENCENIRNYPGCERLSLLRTKNRAIFFTYSNWISEEALKTYKKSELFTEVWKKTKILFNDKPRAWSTELVKELK